MFLGIMNVTLGLLIVYFVIRFVVAMCAVEDRIRRRESDRQLWHRICERDSSD